MADWYCKISDQILGPMSLPELRFLASQGKLRREHQIREGIGGRWVAAGSATGVFGSRPSAGPPNVVKSAIDRGALQNPTAPAHEHEAIEPQRPAPGDAKGATDSPETSPEQKLRSPLDRSPDSVFSMDEVAAHPSPGQPRPPGSLDYEFLLPIGKLFDTAMLKRKAVRWVLLFGLFPLVLAVAASEQKLEFWHCASALGAYFCLFWATYFYGIIGPAPKVWRRGLKWATFTATIGVLGVVLVQQLPIANQLYSSTRSESLTLRLIGFVVGVGVLEETCKAFPLLLFGYWRGERFSLRDGIFLGMMSGFGFAFTEVVEYSVLYWNNSAEESAIRIIEAIDNSTTSVGNIHGAAFAERMRSVIPRLSEFYGQRVLAQIVRFMTLPLLHAAWGGIAGWFIAVASNRQKRSGSIVVLGVGLMAAMHGLYDVFSDGWLGVLIAAASLLMLMGYLVHGQQISQDADHSEGAPRWPNPLAPHESRQTVMTPPPLSRKPGR